jgi:hypothetical protein
MPDFKSTTTKSKNSTGVDVLVDLTRGSALLAPTTRNGERFLESVNCSCRPFGAVFCRRDLAELLIIRAEQAGLRVGRGLLR